MDANYPFNLMFGKITFLHPIFMRHLSNAPYSLISICLHLKLLNVDNFTPFV